MANNFDFSFGDTSSPYSNMRAPTGYSTTNASTSGDPNASGSSYITPERWANELSPLAQATKAQQSSLSSISSLVDQYLNPGNINNTDYAGNISNINNQTNAIGANNSLHAGINSIISQYDPNGQFSKDVLARYKAAEANYGTVNMGVNSPDKMTNIGQLYTEARKQFDPYQDLGSQSVGALKNLQGLSGAEAQKSAIDQLMSGDYVQGQLKMGSQAVAQQASSSGMLRSGATLQALQAYGQQLAGNTLQQQVTNLTNNVSIGNQASAAKSQLYNQQNAAEFARAGALSQLKTAPITTRLQMNEQALSGYNTQAQSQGALQSYMNNYMNTYNNAQTAQGTLAQQQREAYAGAQAKIAASQGTLAARLAASIDPMTQQGTWSPYPNMSSAKWG